MGGLVLQLLKEKLLQLLNNLIKLYIYLFYDPGLWEMNIPIPYKELVKYIYSSFILASLELETAQQDV